LPGVQQLARAEKYACAIQPPADRTDRSCGSFSNRTLVREKHRMIEVETRSVAGPVPGERKGRRPIELRHRLRSGGVFAVAAVVLAACGSDAPTDPVVDPPPAAAPLRELAAARNFWIGTAIGSPFPSDARYTTLLGREFNVLVADNDMKFSYLQPTRGGYRFQRADEMVAFAESKQMRVRGHTLVWHSAYQLPGWLTTGNWTREQLIGILEDHISTVVGRYKGRIYAWDVVNEAFDEQGRMRAESFWYQRLGREYIEIAFRAAHAADPGAVLFYNDYNLEWRHAKSDSAYALVADFKARGVPIHGVGFQGHMLLDFPSRDALSAEMQRFAGLGMKLEITELDIRMQLPATPDKLATQATRYREVVNVCLQSSACDTVVVWGVHDGDSWVPSAFPGQGAALLFDATMAPKPAYWAVHELLK
jgi:endo-1,4-beta-xylanase